jgi:GNAT superfamily N-acetyltransferase
MNIIIRPAIATDEPAFLAHSLSLSRFNRTHHPQADDFEAVLQARAERAKAHFHSADPDQIILIATVDDACVGYALAAVYQPDPTSDNGTERCGLLDEIYLDETARGHGLGRRLAEACMDWMRQRGARRVKLYMYAWNEDARRLYTALGFAELAVQYERDLS